MASFSASGGGGSDGAAVPGDSLDSTLIRRDEYLLEHRAELVAPPEAVASFLSKVRAESLDMAELYVGWSDDKDKLEYGTAMRFLFLAMKHLMEENRKPEDPEEAQEAMIEGAAELVRKALDYRGTNAVNYYTAAAAEMWEQISAEEEASNSSSSSSSGGSGATTAAACRIDLGAVTDRHREQVRVILEGIYQPCGHTDAGIPIILLRPGDFIVGLGEIYVAEDVGGGGILGWFTGRGGGGGVGGGDAAAAEGGGEGGDGATAPHETYPDVEFTPALVGVTDSVFKVACAEASKKAGTTIDRVVILVDCGNLDLFKVAEVKRLTSVFFDILKEVCPETLEKVLMVNVPGLISVPVDLAMRLFTDEDSYRRLQFVNDPIELAPFVGEANIPPVLFEER